MHRSIGNMTKYDAIVVGAGIAGLTSAAYLAVSGKRTLLLDQADLVGGCTHVFRRQSKWEFEVGVHYLGDCGPGGKIPSILNGLGLEDRIEFLPLDPDGFDTLNYPGLSVKVPVGWDRYLENLVSAFPDDEPGLTKWIHTLRTLSSGFDRDRSLGQLSGVRDIVKDAGFAARWALRPMTALMDHCGLEGRARHVVSSQFCAYACPPSRAPVALHAGFLDGYVGKGAYYPRGGGQVLAAHLVDVIESHGGEVRTRAAVDKIVIAGNRVAGVQLEVGEYIPTDVVISAADIKQTMIHMVGREHLARRTTKRIETARMSSPWMNVYIGVSRDLRQAMPAGNVFEFPSWDEPDTVHAALVDDAHLRPRESWLADAEERMYALVHCGSAKDPGNTRLAPPGHSVLEAMTPMPSDPGFWGFVDHEFGSWDYSGSPAYEEIKEKTAAILIDRAIAAVPEIKDHIVFVEASTPMTQQRYTRSTQGSAYGIEYAGREIGPLRPEPATEVRGLYLAGCSGRWGPAVEGSMLSGMNAAGAVLGRKFGAELSRGVVLGDPARLSKIESDWDPVSASKRHGRRVTTTRGSDSVLDLPESWSLHRDA